MSAEKATKSQEEKAGIDKQKGFLQKWMTSSNKKAADSDVDELNDVVDE